jgi:hypothetical protein
MGSVSMGSAKARHIKSWRRIIKELEFLVARINKELEQDLTESEKVEMKSRLVSVTAQLNRAYEELQRLERSAASSSVLH